MIGWILNRAAWGVVALAVWQFGKRYQRKCSEAKQQRQKAEHYAQQWERACDRLVAVEKTVDKNCRSCIFWVGSNNYCNYMAATGMPRPRSPVGECRAWRWKYGG